MGGQKAKSTEDERIIGTNDYSIVSKRSVEKLYLSDEPEYLRPLVGKFKRRAPLINRGYWLRMKAIEHVVRKFLELPLHGNTRKVVVNLGCGYDSLPFRMRWKFPRICQGVRFVDVDYPQLIEKKVEILQTGPIYNVQEDIARKAFDDDYEERSLVVFHAGEEYFAIGCDLQQVDRLKNVFGQIFSEEEAMFLFVAEVSITYMPTAAADAILKWSGTFKNSRFCLLEQFLPDGSGHPFADTMLHHFGKSAPLKSIQKYPSLRSQESRFADAGWLKSAARNLWSIWQDSTFLTDKERAALDLIEPFDEWEELALFAGHYFLLVAGTEGADDVERSLPFAKGENELTVSSIADSLTAKVISDGVHHRTQSMRRCGAISKLDTGEVVFYGGQTFSKCENPASIFSPYYHSPKLTLPPESLSFHTVTYAGTRRKLLIGGRTSPLNANPKCWISENSGWTRSADLSPGRYRHCAIPLLLEGIDSILVFGGKTANGSVLDEWVLWNAQDGWRVIQPTAISPGARFGANIIATQSNSGLLLGGMSEAGTIMTDVWRWELERKDGLELRCSEVKSMDTACRLTICRFGATLTPSRWGHLLTGGVSSGGIVERHLEFMVIEENLSIRPLDPPFQVSNLTRPLLIGHGAVDAHHGNVLVVGGGAVCFSFGSSWNGNCFLISAEDNAETLSEWRCLSFDTKMPDSKVEAITASESIEATPECARVDTNNGDDESLNEPSTASMVPRMKSITAESFVSMMENRTPALIQNQSFGPCDSLWTKEYLMSKVSADRSVSIHQSNTAHLSFRSKNFRYESVPFNRFVEQAAAGKHVYLRAISATLPSKLPACLERDFPEIASDFIIPSSMKFARENMHSSVLRISGHINMWLHYDVMANILCQIRGSKHITLFPPSSIRGLNMMPGETTSDLDCFGDNVRELVHLHPMETVLNEGECLFIPACWPHATTPAGDGEFSVAINLFFKNLAAGYAVGRDVYGNRDLAAYEEGRRDLQRVISNLRQLDRYERNELMPNLEALLRGELTTAGEVTNSQTLSRDVGKIRNRLKSLPQDLEEFYRLRLMDELSRSLLATGL